MNKFMVDRINNEARIVLETKMTIREVAKLFNISKSTVHKDLNERLYDLDNNTYEEVKKIFKEHIDVRHIRGGESTKRKYLSLH